MIYENANITLFFLAFSPIRPSALSFPEGDRVASATNDVLVLDLVPCGAVVLPRRHVRSVSSVRWSARAGPGGPRHARGSLSAGPDGAARWGRNALRRADGRNSGCLRSWSGVNFDISSRVESIAIDI